MKWRRAHKAAQPVQESESGIKSAKTAGSPVPSSDLSQQANLKVDARASTPRSAFIEFDSLPQTTCFGFRRKPSAKKEKTSTWMEEELNAALSPRRDSDAQPSRASSSRSRLCGAGAILRSFGSIGPEMVTDSTSLWRKSTSLTGGKSKDLDLDDEELPPTPAKIMASYDSIPTEKADMCSHSPERDGDRDDGADSIGNGEEEDTFSLPTWTVDPHDIYFISKGDGSNRVCRLGKGDFGPVYLGVWQDQEVAVKLARQKPISLKQERQFLATVSKLHALHHPNVVQFLGACCWKGGKRSVLVTEYMDKGDLHTLLTREDLTAKFAWVRHGQTVALDIAQGLAFLHRRGIVHGRLKSSNVLMNKAGVAKISDVALLDLLSHCKGWNVMVTQGNGKLESSLPCIAPEVLTGGEPTTAADVYSFGVLLWELLSMESPDARRLRPIRTPEEAPARIAYLVECCLDKEPGKRPSADKIVAVISGKH